MTVIPFPGRVFDPDPQRTAADPGLSAFVTANAGSGKTKTLIDRVARLLLAGARPETILCVTYTKAAAAEMQRRLYGLLGEWSIWEDGRLAQELGKLEGRDPAGFDATYLSRARALFAQALETPGGLKIQTIHAFCEKLLRRFPLEAGVSPGFRVMDDTAGAAVADAARKAVARHAMQGEGAVADAYARFSVALDYQAFQSMFASFEAQRGRLATYLESQGGLAGAIADVWQACCNADQPIDLQTFEDEATAGFDARTWAACAAVLDQGGKADQTNAGKLRAAMAAPSLDAGLKALFTEGGEGTPATWVAKTSGFKAHENLRMALLAEQDRLEGLREWRRAANVAWDTAYALVLADAYLTAYRIEKEMVGGLDFADLIEKTVKLTAHAPAAAWVLYKLDGGIAHMLVDEAQDTAPEQWEIVRALAGEFFSGAGLPPRAEDLAAGIAPLDRNMFVVGDEKQSIYSFQGAAPEILIQEFTYHHARATGAGFRFERVDLLASWRSTPQILQFVDATFAPEELAGAILPRPAGDAPAEPIRHEAVRTDAGCIDLWPLDREEAGETRDAWDAPLDQVTEQSANRRLAERIAGEIDALLKRGDAVLDKDKRQPRPATPGDVLILVRRRKALFEEILRALKRRKIPVAGADRLALSEHILFDDLLALARFALFPRDELTLAALLRSPFCDLDDDSLYALAHGRKVNLWDQLAVRADERVEWRAALELLTRSREEAAGRRPFEFYSRLLGSRDAQGRTLRARMFRRLGAEAEDALDEFLAQVLAAEARGVEDLECLAAALVSLDITVKRELEAGRDEVRVMTAHGAKGLEAPIVFLPETTLSRTARGSPLLATEAGGFLWSASQKGDCEASAQARARRALKDEQEALRLLYVALTRARDRLVLCGRVSARTNEDTLGGWWGALRAAFAHPDIAPLVSQCRIGELDFARFGPDPKTLTRDDRVTVGVVAIPVWTGLDAPAETYGRYASPSDLGEDVTTSAASPLAGPAGLGRFRRGDLIHRLLQVLPDLPPATRAEAAGRMLGREPDLTPDQRTEMIRAALGVLEDTQFAEVFGPGSRAEVGLAGMASRLPAGLAISGRLDRLVVLPDRVLVADFKTNRPSPDRIEDADPAYLRQMAMYAAVLCDVFPGRTVEAALVWTDGPKLMPIPELLITQTLAELGRNG
jgi:ATP-dependent helicase/nuclease subunit A